MLLSINQLADELSLSRSSIYRLLSQGIPYQLVMARKRFDLDEVLEWFKNKTIEKE